ncbi:MAG: hypothetical protein CMB02_05040 [Euryarchaeota archaeon]|nr:hypothetical protein [Euryarchaeota archaeon]
MSEISITLASASHRRRAWISEILANSEINLNYHELGEVEPVPNSNVEVSLQTEHACMVKAEAVASQFPEGETQLPSLILVSDTLVEDPDNSSVALGKPEDELIAASTLIRLSGRRHKVWSSTAILDMEVGDIELKTGWRLNIWTNSSIVEFDDLDDDLMHELIESRSWFGKAGGYDIAGMAQSFARVVQGEEVTVLGFSSDAMKELFDRIGF